MPGPTRFVGSFTGALPPPTLPEVAFAGRSNVGKSSLLNALVGVKGLARVAKTPGRTQAINLFEVQGRWIAVDLPGYGYAKVSQAMRASWKGLIEGYLGTRETLRMVVALLDARLPPQDADRALLAGLIDAGIPVLPVATKVDALTRGKRQATLDALAKGHGLSGVLGVSSTERIGIDELRGAIERVIR
ncbi:MAG: ribosome biogenesis GTP-binding protein YihA/YsxC [Myxococcota bacterium]